MQMIYMAIVELALIGQMLPTSSVPVARRRGNMRDGDLVLEGGTAPGTGNVLVYKDGNVWAICDDGWNLQAAKVACRSLGFEQALGHTSQSYFGQPTHDIGLDNVQCHGDESSILRCEHDDFGTHNCDRREAAGVFCVPKRPGRANRTTTTKTTTVRSRAAAIRTTRSPRTTTTNVPRSVLPTPPPPRNGSGPGVDLSANELYREVMQLDHDGQNHERHRPSAYQVRIVNGRHAKEGLVEIRINDVWGVVCSDHWTLLEARVACRQAGLGLSRSALQVSFFGGENMTKLASGIHCDGEESSLSDCYHEESGHGVTCPRIDMIAGVVCATELPDLVPNATLLMTSAYLHDQSMYYLQCAMEENCAASSAFTIKSTRFDWHIYKRRLLRFSCSIWNFGTADFRPDLRKEDWEWHLCHMHYHSMQIFAHYDILDRYGNRVAEGHKASFCLEDVQCAPNVTKKYACKGFGDQGISVGCADDYLHDIDCQWIDVTDVQPGTYIFKVHINPEYKVAELDYDNNAAICNLTYSGFDVKVFGCILGRG